MKISKIYIKKLKQFQDVKIDLTHPLTGEPLEKVCFIGRNGTGKTQILVLIKVFLDYALSMYSEHFSLKQLQYEIHSKVLFELYHNDAKYYALIFKHELRIFKAYEASNQEALLSNILSVKYETELQTDVYRHLLQGTRHEDFIKNLILSNNSNDLLIFSPAESSENGYKSVRDVPNTNVNEALELSKNYPYYAEVSHQTINVFWKLLVYNLRKRAEERETYENLPENLKKTKEQLINEFDSVNPKVLDGLDTVWDKILKRAGLYFDVVGASNPYQLTDNLKAYIRLKSNDKLIPYDELSTGIRNYIFRLGHIFSLYFNRSIDRGFLLVDEPENSLFPDFLFDLVETYQQVIIDKRGQNNTQMFFATHNPIVAAQFEPYERIILDWNEDGSVSVKKGVAPAGDDPNDVLTNDFELKDLMGPEGRKMWDKYESLKKKLIRTSDKNEKEMLILEISKIGSLYNFS